MSSIDLGDLTIRDIGRQVSITRQGTSITGRLEGFQVETDWITESTHAQHPDDWEKVPGRRTMTLSVGPWSATGLPLDTSVEVDR